jgi:RNA polymerase sigma-70 factor, ECF subfamily
MKDDLDLVREAKAGSRAAFSELVTRHQRAMVRAALRLVRDWNLAEDIVQESFIKAFQGIKSFAERSTFRSWLYQITLNTAKNRLRTLHRETPTSVNLTLAVIDDPTERLIAVDIKKVIQEEISKLPPRQRMALTLRIYEDLSFKEIADAMNCPYDTAKANYRHALLKLKESLEGEFANINLTSSEPMTWNTIGFDAVEVDG